MAVIGIGCRFAGGVDSPDAFWDLLATGRDGITQVPPGRWDGYADLGAEYASALRRATRWGGFIAGVEGFDAEFFGLTPREAEFMDPQQRILLEVTWEALEHAGIPPHSLAGGDTGVFVGIGSDDYGRRMLEDLPRIEAWTGIGAAMCAAANRISYALDLRGPSIAVDTACSASLVAVHLACQSLRTGEGPMAIAAGVNLIISPGLTLALDAAGAMAPDGRSKSFDASADGYGRGEGCGVLVLKTLADARRDGDRVLAVIRGSAVNQDGRTNGIMAPSGEAQRHVIERACRQAGVTPETVTYVEAHGTGTRLGDPLEVAALGAVYGQAREGGSPCLIGSVKSNIGHLEAAAGVAGIIKVVLALGHAEIPPSLNYTTPNPAIEWDATGLRVVTERTAWTRGARPRRAGVSAFGFGGTIAHVVLEEAEPEEADPEEPEPEEAEPAGAEGAPRLFPLSAASRTALRQYAGSLADWLAQQGDRAPLPSIGHTLARRRTHQSYRAAVVAADSRELAAGLRRIADDAEGLDAGDGTGVVAGCVPAESGAGLVWVFSGHGAQWAGMGRELLGTEPAFAAVIDSLEPIFLAEIGFSPRRALTEEDFDTVDRSQAVTFALQLGLAEVWRSRGVTPDAVIGHSVGEIAAAVACGVLTPQDAARLICRRSRLLRRVAGQGGMAMVALPFDQVEERLAGRGDVVAAIAASPSSTVISGDAAAVAELTAQWQAAGMTVRRVASDVAFHSPQMDPLLAHLSAAAADLSPARPRVPMYSTALPDPRAPVPADGPYWAANLRSPVRLAAAVQAAAQDGYRAFLEIAAHPVVAHSIEETVAELGFADAFVGSSLRRNRPEGATLLASAGAIHCYGLTLDWTSLHPDGELITLPPVAWQRRSYWRESSPRAAAEPRHDVESHTLLGAEVQVAGRPVRLWRTELVHNSRPYPGSHTINGVEIVPAASLVTTLLAAASDDGLAPALTDVSLRVPLTVAGRREVQVVYDEDGVRLSSRTQPDGQSGVAHAWLTHTTAAVAGRATAEPPETLDVPGPAEPVEPWSVQRHLAAVGVPTMAFEWTLNELFRGDGRLRAGVRAQPPPLASVPWAPLLDAAMSIAPAAFPGDPILRMVAHIDVVHLAAEPPAVARIDITVDQHAEDTLHVLIADQTGQVRARLGGLRYAAVDRDLIAATDPAYLVSDLVWRQLSPSAEAATGAGPNRVVIIGPDAETTGSLSGQLTAAGVACTVLTDPGELDRLPAERRSATDVLVVPPRPAPQVPVTAAAVDSAWLLTTAVQRLAALSGTPPARLWCVTRGVLESTAEAHLAYSPMWGVGRIAAGEHPELWGGVIDLPPGGLGSAGELLRILRAAPGEDVIALRDGTAMVPRLARPAAGRAGPGGRPVACRPDGTYLITGGLGALGLEVAGWLAERGARHIVLVGRRAGTAQASRDDQAGGTGRRQADALRGLEARGVTVRTLALDIADAEAAARALSEDALGLPPIRGVVHAAGVLDNRLISGVDKDSLRTVMHPKVEGAWVLHTLFPPGSLDFLVLFSSCGYLLGLPGQAGYGAANAFLDALAAHRRRTGHDETMSLGWTSWRGKGMAVNEIVDIELRARGGTDISAAEAFGAWDLAASRGGGYHAVLGMAPPTPGGRRPPVLGELSYGAAGPVGQDGQKDQEGPGVPDGLADLDGAELRERLQDEVADQVAAEMRLPVHELDRRRSLVEQGLDSVMTIVIRRRLEKRFAHSLPATLLWNRPTVAALAEHLAELLSAGPRDTEGAADRRVEPMAGA